MTISIRSIFISGVALAISGLTPAAAGTNVAPPMILASVSLPKVAIPDLLANEGEPNLSGGSIDPAVDSLEQDGETDDAVASRPTGDLASMVAELRGSDPGGRELECLATGVYFESKSEPLAGQLAVGRVIANRSSSGRFPSSYCGVILQRGQFSFVRGKSLPAVPRSSKQWKTAVAIAKIIDQDLKQSSVGKALFFHARRVSPGWRLTRVASIGNHIFYR